MMKNWKLVLIAPLVGAAVSAQPLAYTISTVAGGSPAFEFAEGKPATSFLIRGLNQPAADRLGNFYFTLGNRVIKVTPDGAARTYAGTGESGYNGDNIPATSARLTTPTNLLLDPQGRLLIFDFYGSVDNRIRRVEANGNITTIAGNGTPPSSGTDTDGSLATSAHIHAVLGAYDSSGNLFILDNSASDNSINIRRIDTGNRITTVAQRVGTFPYGMASDGTNVYLADLNPAVNRVAKLVGATLVPITQTQVGFDGDGRPSSTAHFTYPAGIACDSAGNLHIADGGDQRIRTIKNNPPNATVASGQAIVSTSAGTGSIGIGADGIPALMSPLASPTSIAVDPADNIYISENGAGRYRRFRLNGTIQTVAGLAPTDKLGDGGPATQAGLIALGGVFRDAAGNLLISDGTRVRQVSPDGIITTIAGTGVPGGSGDNGAPATQAQLVGPAGTVQDSVGNRYVLDTDILRKITPDGNITRIMGFPGAKADEGPVASIEIGSGFSLAIDAQDNIYIGSQSAVRKLTPAGAVTRVAGTNSFMQNSLSSGDARNASLAGARGLAVDANGNLFISDSFASRILKVTPSGQFSVVAGGKSGFSGDGGPASQAQLFIPTGLAFDAWGNLYIADTQNHRIRKIAPDGNITTVAGSDNAGMIPDNGPAVNGQVNLVFFQAIVADPAGNLFFASDNLIRKLIPNKLRTEGVLHAATLTAGPVVAGLRLFLRGTELIPPGAAGDGLRVLFDGQPAGFVSIDGNQIVTVAPAAVAGQTATQIEIEIRGARTNALSLPVVAARPGILSIQNADGSTNGDQSPADSGSTVVLLVTGDGGADPSTLSVMIGGAPANIVDASPSDSMPGVRLFTVTLPDGTEDGSPVVVAVGDAASPGVTIRVQ